MLIPQNLLVEFPISIGNYKTFIEKILWLAEANVSAYVCVANVHMLVEAHHDKDFGKVVQQAHLVAPDGVPITWGLSYFHGIKQDRVAGMDLLPDLLRCMSEKGLSAFFYGGSPGLLRKAETFIRQHYPRLQLAGFFSPPFRELADIEDQLVIDKINKAKPDIIFVVLGCPKQEKWMAKMQGRIDGCMIGIGGALPVLIGIQKRAPVWMQVRGLEWLYRLYQEPKRMFRRYAITNTYFIYLIIRASIKRRFL